MRLRLLPLLLALLVAGACDSGDDELVLDADFYVGTWTLTAISDNSGDRTPEASAVLDDLTFRFGSDRSLQFDADFNAEAEAAGQTDISLAGTYQAQALARTLILESSGFAATLQARADSDDRVTLTAPAVIVRTLLSGLPFEVDGFTSLTITRR